MVGLYHRFRLLSRETAGNARLADIFGRFAEEIRGEVLAKRLEETEPAGYVKEWSLNGETITLGVEKEA